MRAGRWRDAAGAGQGAMVGQKREGESREIDPRAKTTLGVIGAGAEPTDAAPAAEENTAE